MDNFIEGIEKIYEYINKDIDNELKFKFIESYKKKFNMSEKSCFSQNYYELRDTNKRKGIVYTPYEIAVYMIENLISPLDVIKNPFIKIVDPSCGCGNLICACFSYLRNIFINNIESINKHNNINLEIRDINAHIMCNNLFGFDIDEMATKVLRIDLFVISGQLSSNNFIIKDFLMENIDERFDIFIGNPPYIGHKNVDRDYCKILKKMYGSIYRDKGDISYCFFKKSLECLRKGGKLGFITSRYFCEACSGEELRKFLIQNTSIYKIVDFYGIRPFKNVGIDPIIIFLSKENILDNSIEIIKPEKSSRLEKSRFYNSLFLKKNKEHKSFFIHQSFIDNGGWVFIDKLERGIIDKIEGKSKCTLKDICESHQGIITGCDRAFIIDKHILKEKNIEPELIRPWIKSSYIHRDKIINREKFIIYSNFIENEEDCPNSINYIKTYRKKLLNRRECRKGIRKWYELQWGRRPQIFEGKKIVFPYKSKDNRFAIDEGSYFSADVYSLVLKKNVGFTYDDLVKILNSSLYEFYFKTFGKKLGENLYEYYPNNLMKLKISYIDFSGEDDVEKYLYRFFELTEEEIKVVKKDHCSGK
ncbi:N-6 DNA methylase [Clostridium sp. Mt-5]|uniref:site-specific DNA-methyltransferase (adenine-specific) n=1 Tax=Clostridium moutaii TaxID=3240932 RepID=A0ABV4BS64_9CLOT